MATLRQTAQDYVPQQTKNIADLPQVPVDIELFDGTGTDDEGKEFTYKYAVLNNESYLVPNVVIGQIKDIIAESPKVTIVRVKKTGTSLQTRYTTVPIMN